MCPDFFLMSSKFQEILFLVCMHTQNLLHYLRIYLDVTFHKCQSPANTSPKLLFDDRLLGIFFQYQKIFSRTTLVILEKPLVKFSVQISARQTTHSCTEGIPVPQSFAV